MMKIRIRELLHQVPFKPFTIRLADGSWFKIEDPAYVMASPKSHTNVLVEETPEKMHHLPVTLIIGVEA